MSHSIDGTTIPTPQTFNVSSFDIKRESRLASGRLVVDVVATKKSFSLTWVDLTGTEMDSLLNLLYANTFLDYTYPDETGSDTATVTKGDVPRELWVNYDGKRYRGIQVELIEQ